MSTNEEKALEAIKRLRQTIGYFSDCGAHAGMMRVRYDGYLTIDEYKALMALQRQTVREL